VFDLTNKNVIASGSVGNDPDVLALDSARRNLYVSSESGVVSLFDVENGGVRKFGETFFAPHAHTVSVDQKTHLAFFPLQDVEGRPVLRIMRPIAGKE
jgi:DNA-binding beta-propeller fold protein YncE